MLIFFFDIGFNEGKIKVKVIFQRDGKNKQYVEKEKKKMFIFFYRIGNKIFGLQEF